MNRIIALLVAMVIMLFSSVVNAANIKNYPRVAVMQFGNKAITSEGLRTGDFTMCSEYAIYQLLNSGWFDLVDYEQLSNIAKMHSVNMSGLVDQGTAVQLGKIASAQFMIIGNVTGLTLKKSTLGMGYQNTGKVKGDISGNKNTVTANVVMRIVDIETGRIVAAGIGSGSSASTYAEIAFKKYRNTNGTLEQAETLTSNNSQTNSEESNTNTEVNNTIQTVAKTVIEEVSATQSNKDAEDTEQQEQTEETTEEATTSNSSILEDDGLEGTRYYIKIGAVEVSDVQVRNALGKAVRDAVYGKTGLMTTLNGGKQLKVKTSF